MSLPTENKGAQEKLPISINEKGQFLENPQKLSIDTNHIINLENVDHVLERQSKKLIPLSEAKQCISCRDFGQKKEMLHCSQHPEVYSHNDFDCKQKCSIVGCSGHFISSEQLSTQETKNNTKENLETSPEETIKTIQNSIRNTINWRRTIIILIAIASLYQLGAPPVDRIPNSLFIAFILGCGFFGVKSTQQLINLQNTLKKLNQKNNNKEKDAKKN